MSAPPDLYDLAPFRVRALELVDGGSVTWSELAQRAGYCRTREGITWGETSRLKRSLGLMRERSGGRDTVRKGVTYEVAVRLCDALGIDYVDVGV